MKCDEVSAAQRLQVEPNIAIYLLDGGCWSAAPYMAWFQWHSNTTSIAPYLQKQQDRSSNWDINTGTHTFGAGLSLNSTRGKDAAMYLAVFPNMLKMKDVFSLLGKPMWEEPAACDLKGATTESPLGVFGQDSTILACQLYHSTYRTKFEYVNGLQSINTDMIRRDKDIAVPILNTIEAPQCSNGTLYHDMFGSQRQCSLHAPLVQHLSYQSIFQAFSDLIGGTINFKFTSKVAGFVTLITDYSLVDRTRIRSTELMKAEELRFLTDDSLQQRRNPLYMNLQGQLSMSNNTERKGLVSGQQQTTRDVSLKDAIESMFQTLTVSFMSSPTFQYVTLETRTPASQMVLTRRRSADPRSLHPVGKASVTSYKYNTYYVYQAQKLWIAYGLALLITVFTIIVGMLAMVANRASYDSSFSTIMRTTREAELDVRIARSDLDGRIPLPSYMSKATIAFRQGLAPRTVEKADYLPKGSKPTAEVNVCEQELLSDKRSASRNSN